MKNKVIISGIGALCSLGNNAETIYQQAKKGVCGIDYATQFERSKITDVHFTSEVKDFDPMPYISKRKAKRMDRFTQFAVYSAMQAWEDADITEFDPYRAGIIVGSGMGGLKTVRDQTETMLVNGVNTISPLFIPKSIINIAAGQISIELGIHGPTFGIVTACSSGTDALAQAYMMIKNGSLDMVLVGGVEAVICDLAIQGFNQMQTLSNATELNRASIPFDKERNGFVMGEGSGFLVLESQSSVEKRNGKNYGQICGVGQTSDANHITSPVEGGIHAAKAMELAIDEAGIDKCEIGYINAHGTGTTINDRIETAAIKNCFGEHAKDLLVSSTKSMIGHTLGAAGAIEAILTLKGLIDDVALPTINLQVPDEECDLNYVTNGYEKCDAVYAMSNSLGFGGHNSTVVLKANK